MCLELTSLEITLKRQKIGSQRTLQSLVLENFQNPEFGLRHLSQLAADIFHEFGSNQNRIRRESKRLKPEWLSYIGLGSKHFIRPQGTCELNKSEGHNRKRPALTNQDFRPKKASLTEVIQIDSETDTNIITQTNIDTQTSLLS